MPRIEDITAKKQMRPLPSRNSSNSGSMITLIDDEHPSIVK